MSASLLTPELIETASKISTATLHEAAGRIGALPSAIKPTHPDFRVCGPAFTILAPGGDNLWLHRALYEAAPGDILVMSAGDVYEYGYWGEILSTAALQQKLGGLVINAGVRDSDLLPEVGFPVFANRLCIRGTIKDPHANGRMGVPLLMEDIRIMPGDLIVGDNDGVVCLPAADVPEIIKASLARDEKEAGIMERIRAGERTLDIFGLE